MPGSRQKADLQRYLQEARDAMLWKLDGLSEYDIRRPMVPTATNLLGLVKHLTHVELVYFGATFGRPTAEKLPWSPEDPLSDMYAAADESRDYITSLYKKAWVHSDVTIESLSLDAPGRVPHWRGERSAVTLHRIMVHVIAESHRHAGHADIVRELIDGAAGLQQDRANLPAEGADWWLDQRSRVERAAREAASDG